MMTDTSTPRTEISRFNNALFVEQWERLCSILGIEKCSVIDAVDAVAALKHDISRHVQIAAGLVGELEALSADYQRIIREVLACDPQPACERSDDQLEPPWQVIARVRIERNAAEAALAKCFEDTRERCAKVCIEVGDKNEDCSGLTTACYEAIRNLTNESVAAHTDHPMRHWDRTCPACNPQDWHTMTVQQLAEGNPSLKAYSDRLEYELLKLRAAK